MITPRSIHDYAPIQQAAKGVPVLQWDGVTQEQIETVWTMMMSFSGYSFCKPHSASYARVSFQVAYLKVHFPAEFMAAVISNQGGFYSTFAYVSEARRLGLRIQLRADRWSEQQPDSAREKFDIRDTGKGKLKVAVLHRHVWLWDGKEPNAQCWRLVVKKTADTDETKYSISNAPSSISLQRLVYMQGQRFLVERIFQEAKNQCGMGRYQARGWRSWHHHMTMVMLAMQFMLEQQLKNSADYPLLSSNDIVELRLRSSSERHNRR